MVKRLTVSSQPERLVRVNSKDTFGKPLTQKQEAVVKRLAALQAAGDDSRINFREIPALSAKQLAQMVKAREVRTAKVSVSVRLDSEILAWLKEKGKGHLTRINDILANVMDAERRIQRS